MKPVVIGVDPDSKRITVVISIGDDFKVRRKALPETKDVSEWCASAYRFIYRIVKDYKAQGRDVYVGIESPFANPKAPSAVVPLGRLNGAMHAAAYMAGATTYPVTIATWKKEVCGKGNMTKPQIAAWCKVYWRLLWDEAQTILVSRGRQDVIDAGAINRYTLKLLERDQRIAKFHEVHPDEYAPIKRLKKKVG